MKTLDLQEAASFLHMHPDTLQREAAAGRIQGAKPGRCWVFLDVDLADWLRSNYKTAKQKVDTSWASSAETESITSRSTVTDSELSKLLAPATKPKRKNSTTGSATTFGARKG